MSSRSSADALRCRRRPRSRSISISSAASAATCSSRRWSTRCRRSRRPCWPSSRRCEPRASPSPEFGETTSGGLRARRFGLAPAPRRRRLPPTVDRRADRHRRRRGERACGHRVHVASPPARGRAAVGADARARARAAGAPRRRRGAGARHPGRRRAFPRARGLGFAARRRRGRLHRGQARRRALDGVVASAGRRHRAHRAWRPARACAGDEPAARAGYPWHDDGIAGERVTPTGAAILRHLVPAERCDARRDAGRLLGAGCGAGTRDAAGAAEHRARAGARARCRRTPTPASKATSCRCSSSTSTT